MRSHSRVRELAHKTLDALTILEDNLEEFAEAVEATYPTGSLAASYALEFKKLQLDAIGLAIDDFADGNVMDNGEIEL